MLAYGPVRNKFIGLVSLTDVRLRGLTVEDEWIMMRYVDYLFNRSQVFAALRPGQGSDSEMKG